MDAGTLCLVNNRFQPDKPKLRAHAHHDIRVINGPAVLALAGEFGLADPAATYTQLVDWGLVAEAPPEGTDAVAFAAGHQMVPLTYGLGNTADQPDWYGLGFPPKPWVSVPFPVWWLWQEGHLEASLWDACQSIARRERRPGTAVVARVEPHRLLSYALSGMHMLLSIQAAYLDLPRAGNGGLHI